MLSDLFDGAGPLAGGLGQNRLSEALSRVLEGGTAVQRQAAVASAQASLSLSAQRAGMLDLHSRIALGQLTEDAFLRGRPLAERLHYPIDVVDRLPDRLVERFIGLANPFVFGRARPGDVVVDVGCGAGLDAAIAAHDVGEDGVVVGVDATFQMVAVASALSARTTPARSFLQSFAEQVPVRDGAADLVTSNGVFMMCERTVVLAECHRLLRPGGRLQFGETVFETRHGHELIDEWRSLHARALTCDRWRDLLHSAGFTGVEFGPPHRPERAAEPGPAGGRAVMAVKSA